MFSDCLDLHQLLASVRSTTSPTVLNVQGLSWDTSDGRNSAFLRRLWLGVKPDIWTSPALTSRLSASSPAEGFRLARCGSCCWCLWTLQRAGNDEISHEAPSEVTNLRRWQTGALSAATLFSVAF